MRRSVPGPPLPSIVSGPLLPSSVSPVPEHSPQQQRDYTSTSHHEQPRVSSPQQEEEPAPVDQEHSDECCDPYPLKSVLNGAAPGQLSSWLFGKEFVLQFLDVNNGQTDDGAIICTLSDGHVFVTAKVGKKYSFYFRYINYIVNYALCTAFIIAMQGEGDVEHLSSPINVMHCGPRGFSRGYQLYEHLFCMYWASN